MIDYAKALSKDIDNIKNKEIRTIFIGGGTPTYLSLDGWKIIKKSIDKLNKIHDLEFTVEGNPGTFTEENLKLLKDMGVNRLSIGLQAFQNSKLKELGRIHTVEEFIESYKLARKIGFNNINVDLMFGLPNQSLEEWQETLKNVVALNPQHLSCYSLIVEEGTSFFKKFEEGKLNLPSEDEEREMYLETVKYLREKGYTQYEISNFSKDNKECKHNLVYWDLDEYIGCGSAAHSYVGGIRYKNEENIEKYIEAIFSKNTGVVEQHENFIKDDMEEFMFMGLRKIKGISKKQFEKRFNVGIYEKYSDIIYKYVKDGFLVDKGDYIYLSSKGIEVSNIIMAEFLL